MSWLEIISVLFSAICLYRFVNSLGQEINILKVAAAIACITYLLIPVITYNVFNEHFRLSVIWQTIMPIDSEAYFSYALPGTVLLVLGLSIPLKSKVRVPDREILVNASKHLKSRYFVGYLFVILGIFFGAVLNFLPDSLQALGYYAAQLTFVGVFYLLFSPIRYKGFILFCAILVLVAQSIASGMYGAMLFWGLLIIMYLLLKIPPLTIFSKLIIAGIGIFAVFFIQSIKHEYRKATWDDGIRRSDTGLWFSLAFDRLTKPMTIFELERVYNLVHRGNQGFLLGRTMQYVPKKEPFANGETILLAVEASLVPRFLWKNKPELGGVENTCRFLGDCSKRDYSYNIGQVGEAYVNFGPHFGTIFLFLYGLFINWSLNIARKVALKTPTVILWIPLLFYATFSLETDVLTFLNTLVKGIIFCFFIFALFRYVLKWRI